MRKLLIVSVIFLTVFLFSCSSNKTSENDSDSTSSTGPVCGNGIIEEGEFCDGNVACWEVGHFYPETEAVCKDDCKEYNLSACVERDPDDTCGNGKLDDREVCEQGDKKPCTELPGSYVSGDADCNRDCNGWTLLNCSSAGTKTCSQILTCVDGCAADDTCIQACHDSASEQGKTLYEALDKCYTEQCPSGADKITCMEEHCKNEYYACFPNEKCGNGTIDEGEKCEKSETKPCQELGENWQPINEAVCNSTCTDWDMYACVDINDLTCYQVYECVGECSDSTCEEECIAKTWPAAKSKYDTMLECYDTYECAADNENCINENCKFQTDACKTHLTCGNENIDQYEVCEKAETIDCGEIKENGEAIYEAGTANAFCNPNCTEWSGMLCFKFCSCEAVKTCVATNCGDYKTADSECVKECENLGSYEGKNQHKAWRTWIESCSDNDGNAGFDSQTCVDESTKNNPCGSTANAKCEY